jgi:hypothetical protein
LNGLMLDLMMFGIRRHSADAGLNDRVVGQV